MSIKVTSRVWDTSRQHNSRLLLLLALADFAHDSGVCWEQGLKLAVIARKARVTERQARNLLAQIAVDGELYASLVSGRGHTSRYFVLVGLDADTIAATLVREFGHDPQTAAVQAQDLFLRQQRAANGDDANAEPTAMTPSPATPPAATPTPSKRGNPASQNRQSGAAPQPSKRGNLAPQNRQSGAEKGQSGVENRQFPSRKAAIQRTRGDATQAPECPKTPIVSGDPMIHPDPSHDPPPSAHREV